MVEPYVLISVVDPVNSVTQGEFCLGIFERETQIYRRRYRLPQGNHWSMLYKKDRDLKTPLPPESSTHHVLKNRSSSPEELWLCLECCLFHLLLPDKKDT